MKNTRDKVYQDKITELHDFLLEDNETMIPPMLMEGYEEPNDFWFRMGVKWRTTSVEIKARLFGLATGLFFTICGLLGASGK